MKCVCRSFRRYIADVHMFIRVFFSSQKTKYALVINVDKDAVYLFV